MKEWRPARSEGSFLAVSNRLFLAHTLRTRQSRRSSMRCTNSAESQPNHRKRRERRDAELMQPWAPAFPPRFPRSLRFQLRRESIASAGLEQSRPHRGRLRHRHVLGMPKRLLVLGPLREDGDLLQRTGRCLGRARLATEHGHRSSRLPGERIYWCSGTGRGRPAGSSTTSRAHGGGSLSTCGSVGKS